MLKEGPKRLKKGKIKREVEGYSNDIPDLAGGEIEGTDRRKRP